jgi:hypothetical protein
MISLACARARLLFRRALRRKFEVLLAAFPAARPSAICFWRVSIARNSGGQMNLTVNQMNARTRVLARSS